MASANVHTITQATFSDEVLKSTTPVLVDFWAEWCMPCKMVAPFVDQIADEWAGRLKVCKVDTDQHGAVASQYGIMSIPTLMVFKNGEPVERLVGAKSKRDLQVAISRHL
ncbi:MAG: thioredoxin [Symbiobacteriia bacterium]